MDPTLEGTTETPFQKAEVPEIWPARFQTMSTNNKT